MSRRALIPTVLLVLVLSGCGATTRETATQTEVFGPVHVDVSVCAFGHSDDGTCEFAGNTEPYQGLIALRLPAHVPVPDTLTLRAATGEKQMEYARDATYEAELETGLPAGEGMRWHGFLGPEDTFDEEDEREWLFSLDLPLPPTPAGVPFPGPYRERVLAGFREISDTQPPDRPVDCTDPPTGESDDGTVCLNTDTAKAVWLRDTRDLAIAGSSPTSAVRADATSVTFELRFRGPAGPELPLTASTTLPGATAVPRQATFAPDIDETRTVAVDLQVPPGTPDGDYPVTLTATASSGEQRSGTAVVRVAEGLQEPRKLSLRSRPARDRRRPYRFTLSGALSLPDGLAQARACTGKVAVTIKAGRRTRFSREVDLAPDCTYRVRGRSSRRGALRASARFLGNDVLEAASAPTTRLRAG